MVLVQVWTLSASGPLAPPPRPPALSDGDGADDDFVLQHDADDEEDEVEQEHEEAQHLAHAPLADGDGYDDEEEHEEEEDDGAEQAVAAHLHRLEVVEDVVDEPGEGQAARRRRRKWGRSYRL